MTPIERFWAKTQVSQSNQFNGSQCVEWRAATSPFGHGYFWADGRMRTAHRWVYTHQFGPLSDDLVIDHLCRNPPCVNTLHMEPVSAGENVRRGKKGWADGTCQRGHDITDPSVARIHSTNGERYCHVCRMDYQREWRAARKELANV